MAMPAKANNVEVTEDDLLKPRMASTEFELSTIHNS